MTLLAPGFLLLLLVVPLVALLPRRATDGVHTALRMLVLALLVLALAEPVATAESSRAYHAFVVDASDSVPPAVRTRALESARDAAAALPGDARDALVVLGNDVSGNAGFDVLRTLPASASLAEALAAAEATIPDGAPGAVTVFTDGASTDAGPRARDVQVARLAARGIAVHVVPLPTRTDEVRLVAFHVEGEARVGHPVRVHARISGARGGETVHLRGRDGDVGSPADVTTAGDHAVTFTYEPAQAGFEELSVVVAGPDGPLPHGTLARTVAVQDAVRTLYLGGRVEDGATQLGRLLGAGFRLDAPATGDVATVPDFGAYDLVVLDDRAATDFPEAHQRALASAVVDRGVGLALTGGPAAFGPGGYHDTPLAEVSPVEAVQREEKRDPSTTLAIIIDTSGSMGGNRVQLAKEVARLAIRRLLPHDKVGIVEFFGAKRWAAPIQPASNAIELQRALNRLDAGGGTVILPAIEEAFYGMQNVQTRYKHVLVLTDGGVEQGAFEPLLRKMADEGMNVSTVLIGGSAHSEFLVSLANWGKGRFYAVPNRFNLPEILLKQPTTARLPAYRPGEHPVRPRAGRAWWGPVEPGGIPPLAGYVQTRVRDGAEVVLETEQGGHPLLASWRHGLGRVTAFTTEPTGPGTEPWRTWDGYGPWLARVLGRTATDADTPYAVTVTRVHDLVRVLAVRTVPDAAAPVVTCLEDDGSTRPVAVRERAPGWFEGTLRATPSDDVRLTVGVPGGATVRRVAARIDDRLPERQVPADGHVDLEGLAASTGGSVLSLDRPRVPALATRDSERVHALAPWALLLALLAYFADLFHRRRARPAVRGSV